MWYVPTLFLSQSAHISPCIALLSLMRKLVVLYSTAYDPQPQMIPCTVLFTLLVDCKQLSFFPQSQCSKLCKLMVKRRRDWGRERGKRTSLLSSLRLHPHFVTPPECSHSTMSQKKNKRLLAVYLLT